MQRTTLAVLVVAVVALVSVGGVAAADDGAVQDEMVTIELFVTTADGEAVGNADVTIEWDGGSVETTTRSNGRAFEDVPAGADLEITAEHDQYVKNVPHQVSEFEANQVVEVEMHQPATLTVDVSDDEGALEDATVRLRRFSQSQAAAEGTTDADGQYTSPDVEAGEYDLRVVKPGYYVNSTQVSLEGDVERSIVLEEGSLTVDASVVDPTPEGPGQVSADVVVVRDGEQIKTVTTSSEDSTGVSLDVNTRYELTAERDGYRSNRRAIQTDETDTSREIEITRTPSISLDVGNEQVVVGQPLRVEVTDEYDRPVEGATVTLDGSASGETDADGVANVEIASEGEHTVSAELDDLSTESATVEGISQSQADDGNETDGDGDGDGDDGSPGFGLAAAALAAMLGAALLARRS